MESVGGLQIMPTDYFFDFPTQSLLLPANDARTEPLNIPLFCCPGLKATNCWYYSLVTDPAPPEPNPTHSSLSMVEIILIQSSWFFRPSTSWVGCQRPGWESDGKCLEMFWSVYFQSRSSLWRIVRNFPDPFSARTLTMTRLARARQHSTDLAVPFIFGSCFE